MAPPFFRLDLVTFECIASSSNYSNAGIQVTLGKSTILPLASIPVPSFEMNRNDDNELFEFLKILLEDLVGIEWLESPARTRTPHLVSKQWQYCVESIANNGRMKLNLVEREERWKLGMQHDAYNLYIVSGAGKSLRLGDFPLYVDRADEIRARCRAKDDAAFLSVQSELSTLAWCLGNGFDVQQIPVSSRIEFIVTEVETRQIFHVECKQPQSSGGTAVKNAVRSANKKFRGSTNSAIGLLVLDLRRAIGILERGASSDTPMQVIQVANQLRELLHDDHSSVSAALVVWDEVRLRRRRNDSKVLWVSVQRKSLLLPHRCPGMPLPKWTAFSNFGTFAAFDFFNDDIVPSRWPFIRRHDAKWCRFTMQFGKHDGSRMQLTSVNPEIGWKQFSVTPSPARRV